jgi:hypothetical protein
MATTMKQANDSSEDPFTSVDDAIEFMICAVASEAESDGVPLSAEELAILGRKRKRREKFERSFEERIRSVIRRIVEQEKSQPFERKRNFLNASEFNDNQAYPVIVELAEDVFREFPYEAPPLPKGWKLVKELALLFITGAAVVLCLFFFVAVIEFIGRLLGF